MKSLVGKVTTIPANINLPLQWGVAESLGADVKELLSSYTLTKEYADQLRQKMWAFQQDTKTNKHLTWVLLSAFGLAESPHALGLVSQVLTLEDLFGG